MKAALVISGRVPYSLPGRSYGGNVQLLVFSLLFSSSSRAPELINRLEGLGSRPSESVCPSVGAIATLFFREAAIFL